MLAWSEKDSLVRGIVRGNQAGNSSSGDDIGDASSAADLSDWENFPEAKRARHFRVDFVSLACAHLATLLTV